MQHYLIFINMKIFIKQLLRESLEEVRYVDAEYGKTQDPIGDAETIRVYHGFYRMDDVKNILENGLHGKARAKRIYSYESGNNPYGLFVSVSFDVVKRNFASSGVIMEFSTKVSDLEAPVWVDGRSYFVQGEYTKSFKDLDDREKQRLINRQKEGESPYEHIAKSDRPELAATIFDNPEKQALYVGDLNPNMVKNVWYNETLDKKNLTNGPWEKYSRKDFIKLMNMKPRPEVSKQTKGFKRFRPNDDFSIDYFKRYGENHIDKYMIEFIKDFINGDLDEKRLKDMGVFPKQIAQMFKLRDEGYFDQFVK